MPKNYLSELEREDGTILTIKDAEACAAINEMDPTLQQILQGVNDIKSSIGDVGEIVEEVLVGPPTLIEKTITENGTYAAEDDDADGYSSVTVDVSGGGGSSGNDVIFYDYDGSIVTSYSAADFANLSAMPANPTHEGLTAQGWNWSLANAKNHVASYGKLNIGQMYITSDGKTRLYFTVIKNSGLLVQLYLSLESNTELDIDWGDGSAHTRWTSDDSGFKSHEYASAGRYVAAITVVTGGFTLLASSDTYKIEIGNGVTSIGDSAFSSCSALSSITIPDGVTSIGDSAFRECYALSSVTISNSVTSISDNAFESCYALSSVTIPDSVTSSIGTNAFSSCYSLSSITIPDGVTSIGEYTFYDCHALSSITIPDGVTSIGNNAFYSCSALSSVTIPSSVTSIDSSFNSCYTLSSVTFESSTPPEVPSDLGIPYTCIIRVPQGSLSDYTSASNYPDPSQYIYEEY